MNIGAEQEMSVAKRKKGSRLATAYLAIQDADTVVDIGRALLRSVGINNPLPDTVQAALDAYYRFEADMETIESVRKRRARANGDANSAAQCAQAQARAIA
jgi:hypothetical protein